MKVNSKNLKDKFLAQLRKHLESPSLKKILHHKKQKIKKSSKKAVPNLEIPAPSRYSPGSVFRVKLIKKAGEKLKEGLKRHWDIDTVAKTRRELVEYALQKNKVLTASSIVSVEDRERVPAAKKDAVEGCSYSEQQGICSSSSNKIEEKNKEFYLDCSSEESSSSLSQNSSRFPDFEPQFSPKASGIISSSFSLINEEDDRESQCGEDEFNPCLIEEDSQKVDKGVQCSPEETVKFVIENTFNSPLESEAQTIQNQSTAHHPEVDVIAETKSSAIRKQNSYHNPYSDSVQRDACVMLKKLSQFVQDEKSSSPESSADFSANCDENQMCRLAKHFSVASTPQHSYSHPQQSYSANVTGKTSILNEKNREYSSESTCRFHPSLFRENEHIRTKRRNDYMNYNRPVLMDKTNDIYDVGSDSDDDEIMTRIKQQLREDEASMERFFSWSSQQPSSSRFSCQSYVNHHLSDSDSSPDNYCYKPFLRH